MTSLDEYVQYVGEVCQPTMYDEMVWDTLTHEQKISVAKLVRGGVDATEAKLEDAEKKGYDRGYKDGEEQGHNEALNSQEMTDALRARMREILGADLQGVVREMLKPLKPTEVAWGAIRAEIKGRGYTDAAADTMIAILHAHVTPLDVTVRVIDQRQDPNPNPHAGIDPEPGS